MSIFCVQIVSRNVQKTTIRTTTLIKRLFLSFSFVCVVSFKLYQNKYVFNYFLGM